MSNDIEHSAAVRQQFLAGLNYAVCSFAIMFANKFVLTQYAFPSYLFLALSQFIATIIFLGMANQLGIVSFPAYSSEIFWKVFPLPFIFMLNTLSGLGGTQKISIPMFTVLRRFSIVFTMVLEGYYLGYESSRKVKLSVFIMVLGAVIAAYDDLVFDVVGYSYIMFNDVMTALNGVVMKKKLDSKELGTFGLMYYNSLFSLPLLAGYFWYTGEWDSVTSFPRWMDQGFLFCFICASIMGFVLNFSIFYCTKVNSALTTTVIGCLKNILSTYIGMVAIPDYVYSLANFLGINVSVFGSVYYSYVKYQEQQQARRKPILPAK